MQQDASHGLRNTERQQVYQDVYGCIGAMKDRNVSRSCTYYINVKLSLTIGSRCISVYSSPSLSCGEAWRRWSNNRLISRKLQSLNALQIGSSSEITFMHWRSIINSGLWNLKLSHWSAVAASCLLRINGAGVKTISRSLNLSVVQLLAVCFFFVCGGTLHMSWDNAEPRGVFMPRTCNHSAFYRPWLVIS